MDSPEGEAVDDTASGTGDWADFTDFAVARLPSLLAYGLVLSGSGHDAEDLVQEAMARTGARWRSIARKRSAEAYVRTTMARLQIDAGRRRRRERLTDRVPDSLSTDDGIEAVVGDAALWSALSCLAPRQRAVLVLRYGDQLSDAQIADRLNISVGTVKSQISRALDRLRSEPADQTREGMK